MLNRALRQQCIPAVLVQVRFRIVRLVSKDFIQY